MRRAVKVSSPWKMLAFDYSIVAIVLLYFAPGVNPAMGWLAPASRDVPARSARTAQAAFRQWHGSIVPHETHTSCFALE